MDLRLRRTYKNTTIEDIAAAVVNAIHHATGIRILDLPVHCDQLVEDL